MITRRECLRRGGAAALLAASGCAQITDRLHEPLEESPASESPLAGKPAPEEAAGLRTLHRTAFGPRPGDLEHVRAIGLDGYLEEQLFPHRLEESPAMDWRLWRLDTLQADTDFRYEFPKEQVQAELQKTAVIRARYSRRQLQEVMVEFWSDHFNVSQLKGDSAFLKTAEDDAVIRRHALGKFRDLLRASATSPAMLYYLDNARNTNSAGNENYARELMELHTLGVSGGYTQRDVQEVARCFTGWGIQDERTWWRGAYVYRPHQHDDGPRRVLGVALPPGLGRQHGERVLEILAEHPATARFIARKLCRRFVADEGAIPGALIERLARTFRRTDGDIRQMLSLLFRSDEFRNGPTRKLKRPFDFAISALRALNADTDGRGVLPYLRRMGQAPFQWAMPNGYPDRADVWLSSLLGRWNFALALVTNRIPGTHVNLDELSRAFPRLRPEARDHRPDAEARTPNAHAVAALHTAILGADRAGPDARHIVDLLHKSGGADGDDGRDLQQAAALLLMSPAFQWR